MSFFINIDISEILGVILLVIGAIIDFLSKKIIAKLNIKHPNGELIIKCIGFALVVLGFLLILGVIHF